MTKNETKDMARLIDYFMRMMPYYARESKYGETEESKTRAYWFFNELSYIWSEYIPEQWKKIPETYYGTPWRE